MLWFLKLNTLKSEAQVYNVREAKRSILKQPKENWEIWHPNFFFSFFLIPIYFFIFFSLNTHYKHLSFDISTWVWQNELKSTDWFLG